jgi:hypothetical protein
MTNRAMNRIRNASMPTNPYHQPQMPANLVGLGNCSRGTIGLESQQHDPH